MPACTFCVGFSLTQLHDLDQSLHAGTLGLPRHFPHPCDFMQGNCFSESCLICGSYSHMVATSSFLDTGGNAAV